MATTVYSGDEIVAYHNPGMSDYLVVSFTALFPERFGENYYLGKPLIERADISCVGIINPAKNFYLSAEMEHVIRIVDQVRGDRKVIVFGQSLGAYAAIKHSAALRADYVMSCSPFYSVDPDDLDLPSDRHHYILKQTMQHHGVLWRPEFKNMGLKPSDCSGRVVAFYDPFESIDSYDVALLRRNVPSIEFVTVPLASHEICNESWTPAIFSRLMAALQSDDRMVLAREMNTIRRGTAKFMLRTIRKAADRKPEMCARVFRSPRLVKNIEYKVMLADPVSMTLIYRLFARGSRALAVSHFALVAREVMQVELGDAAVDDGSVIEAVAARRLCLLMSCHGSFLAYDMNARTVRLDRNVFRRADLVPIHARLVDGAWVFFIRSESREIPVTISSADPSAAAELVAAGDNAVAVRNGDRYLGVTQTGELRLVPEVLSEQERFVPLPIGEQETVKASSINWFDQALLTQQASALPISNDIAPTRAPRTNRWRRLLGRT